MNGETDVWKTKAGLNVQFHPCFVQFGCFTCHSLRFVSVLTSQNEPPSLKCLSMQILLMWNNSKQSGVHFPNPYHIKCKDVKCIFCHVG